MFMASGVWWAGRVAPDIAYVDEQALEWLLLANSGGSDVHPGMTAYRR